MNKNIVNDICKIINEKKEFNRILNSGTGIGSFTQIRKGRDVGEMSRFGKDLKISYKCQKRRFHVITIGEELAKYKYYFIFRVRF